MPTPTYSALANITLSSTDTEVIFASLPNTYRDLVVIISGIASSYTGMLVKINDSTSNFRFTQLVGTGSSATTNNNSTNDLGAVYNSQFTSVINFMEYATTKSKLILARTGNTANDTRAVASVRLVSDAITSFSFYISGGGTFSSGTTFSLYGIVG